MSRSFGFLRWGVAALLPFVLGAAVLAEPGNGLTSSFANSRVGSAQGPLHSPQATLRTFLDAVANKQTVAAIACLDFDGIQPAVNDAQKAQLAARLHAVLARLGLTNPATLPNRSDELVPFSFQGYPGLAAEMIGDARGITIGRSRDGQWRFTPHTVAGIDDAWSRLVAVKPAEPAVGPVVAVDAEAEFAARLKSLFPPALQHAPFLLPHYQWLALAIVFALGWMIDRGVRVAVQYLTATWFRFVRADSDGATRRGLGRPVGWLAAAIVWHAGANVIGLPPQLLQIILTCVKFFGALAAVLTAFRFIDLLTDYIAARAATTSTRFDDLLVPLVSKTLKTVTACLGGIMLADAYGMEITALLGGLGLGGAALALASKDAVSNMIGSFNLLADRPFEIGDWVIIEGVEGTIEQVGFRSTRIRTFYNSLVTLPNSRLTTAILDNMGRRRYRRLKTSLSLAFDSHTPRIEAFCEGIRELIRRDPYTRKDYFLVYVNQIAEKSLDVQVDCFFECPDLPTELRERHRLMLDILALGDRLRVRFTAAPAQHPHGPADEAQERLIGDDPIGAGQQVAAQIAGGTQTAERRPLRVIGVTPQRAAA
jgi:MscS family membrane protein